MVSDIRLKFYGPLFQGCKTIFFTALLFLSLQTNTKQVQIYLQVNQFHPQTL